jgi:delta24-sterol reductase
MTGPVTGPMTDGAGEAHQARVRRIAEQVQARPSGRRLTIRKAHPGHTPHDLTYKSDCHPVDVDALDSVLHIDRETRSAVVEGQVTLQKLCRAAFAVGLMPKVVPEFETFTVSGLVNGLGIETSSHRHGVFPSSVQALEVVLGNGEVVEIDRERHADLLAYLPGSYGTLGVVTRVTLALGEARPFVRCRYRHFSARRDYVAAFTDALAEHEFVEGFVLSRNDYVLVTGDYSDAVPALDVFDAMTPGRPWFYQHAAATARSRGSDDLVPSYQYMFRHQRSLLWISGIVADLSIFSRTRWGRGYLDRQVEKTVRSRGFKTRLPVELAERCLVNQDMGMRIERLDEGIEYVQKNLGVHPLWNCPVGGVAPPAFARPRRLPSDARMLVDIGIYGEPTVRGFRAFDAMRALQKFVDVPSLWGCCYLSAEELRDIYDFAPYEAVQRKYHATDAFVPLESKLRFMRSTKRQGRIPLWRLVNLWYDLTRA